MGVDLNGHLAKTKLMALLDNITSVLVHVGFTSMLDSSCRMRTLSSSVPVGLSSSASLPSRSIRSQILPERVPITKGCFD
jgi:hypothetical protein